MGATMSATSASAHYAHVGLCSSHKGLTEWTKWCSSKCQVCCLGHSVWPISLLPIESASTSLTWNCHASPHEACQQLPPREISCLTPSSQPAPAWGLLAESRAHTLEVLCFTPQNQTAPA